MWAILWSFLIVGLSEAADKTQLLILALAIKYKQPLPVFLGAFLAHSLLDGGAAIIGGFLGKIAWIEPYAGIAFIVTGFWYFIGEHEEKKAKRTTPFWGTFSLIALSELGDKTQITTGLLATTYSPLLVWLGASIALALAIGINVTLSGWIAKKIKEEYLQYAAGIMVIGFGIMTLA